MADLPCRLLLPSTCSHFVYEVNKEALRGQTNSTGYAVGPRLIPEEAM